jgi:hypothetical protein
MFIPRSIIYFLFEKNRNTIFYYLATKSSSSYT